VVGGGGGGCVWVVVGVGGGVGVFGGGMGVAWGGGGLVCATDIVYRSPWLRIGGGERPIYLREEENGEGEDADGELRAPKLTGHRGGGA